MSGSSGPLGCRHRRPARVALAAANCARSFDRAMYPPVGRVPRSTSTAPRTCLQMRRDRRAGPGGQIRSAGPGQLFEPGAHGWPSSFNLLKLSRAGLLSRSAIARRSPSEESDSRGIQRRCCERAVAEQALPGSAAARRNRPRRHRSAPRPRAPRRSESESSTTVSSASGSMSIEDGGEPSGVFTDVTSLGISVITS